MSDANRVKLAYIDEGSDFGDQKTGSNLQILRYNNESLKQDMNTAISEELRSDRQISDVVRIGLAASGDISFELSFGSHDDFLQAALLSSGWSTEQKISNAITISAASGDNSISDSASGFGNFVNNQWVYISGFSNSANNGFFKIKTATAAKLIFWNGSIITETAGQPITVQMGSQILNGTTLKSFNLEKTFEDLSNVISLFKGMSVNVLSFEVPADGIITGSIGFIGSDEESLTTSGGTGYNAETKTTIMTGANHVDNFLENLSELSILSFSLSLNNNLRTRLQVGNLGVASIGSGSIEITGAITLHLANAALFNKYLNQTVTSIVLAVKDVDGNGYVMELPSVKIVEGVRSAGGLNTDVIGDFNFRAYMDVTEEISIRIVRFPIMANLSGYIAATSTVTAKLNIA